MELNDYGVCAFRSRSQAYKFYDILKRAGLTVRIISSPKEIAVGCGISVRIETAQLQRAVDIYKRNPPNATVGFYRVQWADGKAHIYPFKL